MGKCEEVIKKSHRFEISAPIWNKKFDLPDGSYSVWDIKDYFEYILEKHGEKTGNPSMRIYVNKMQNRIIFKFKTDYYLECLSPETIKLFGSTKSKITADENDDNVPQLEITEIVLVHCHIVTCQGGKFIFPFDNFVL